MVGNVLVFRDRHHLTALLEIHAPFLEPLLLKANPALAAAP